MDFESNPAHAAARAAADRLSEEVLPLLPATPDEFFLEARTAMEDRGLLREESMALAARTAMALGAASGSLALVYAACHGFAWSARRLASAGSRAASDLIAARDQPVGVMALGDVACGTETRGGVPEISGKISLVAGGPVASQAVLITARTNPGLIALVDVDHGDVVREPSLGGLGFERVPKCSLRFDGVRVERSSVTSPGSPERSALDAARSSARVLAAAAAVGIGRRAFGIVIGHLRSLGNRPSQSTEFSLSDVATDLDAAELSVLRAGWAIDRGSGHVIESASAVLLATRAATRAAHSALALSGSAGYTDDLRRCYLDACALESNDGSSAEHEGTIASAMLEES